MFVSLAYAATVALLSLRSFVYASPLVPRAGQGVWNPHITAPGAGDVWTVGSTQLVTWDTDDIPPSAMGRTGTLLLGYFDEGTHGENLDTYHPLAEGFFLTDSSVSVQVPDVKPRDTYIVVLMGNSGNASPEFTITKHRSKPGTTHRPFNDDGISHENSGNSDSKQLPPGSVPVSPNPAFPDLPVSDSKADPIELPEPTLNDTPAPAQCKGRPSNSRSGSTSSLAHDKPSGQGPDRHC